MGAPSHNDLDRGAAPNAEVPIDEGWSAPAQVHNDQTTAGLYVSPASFAQLTNGNPDGTKLSARRPSTTALAEGTDQILAELQRPEVTLPEPDNDIVRDENEPELAQPELAQPERSPLDLVMRELEPDAPKQTSGSNDSSRFIVSLMGDHPPPRVETESAVIAAMEPVLRRRRQRIRIVAGALAATAVLATAGALLLTREDEKPHVAASEAATVDESPAPMNVATAARATNIATPIAAAETEVAAPSEHSHVPAAADVQPEPSSEPTAPKQVAIATKAETPATRTTVKSTNPRPTSSKRATTRKTVALKQPTAKKPTATKTSTKKKTAPKKTTAKVTTAKTSAVKKSSTTVKRKTKR